MAGCWRTENVLSFPMRRKSALEVMAACTCGEEKGRKLVQNVVSQ